MWCDLHIDPENNEMVLTVPQKALDEAVYPLVIDPTFGYTSQGASGESTAGTVEVMGSHHTAPASGVITEISCYMREQSTSAFPFIRPMLALYSDGSFITQDTECGSANVGTSYTQVDRDVYSDGEISNGVAYWLMLATFSAGGYVMYLAYDSGPSGSGAKVTAMSTSTGYFCTKSFSPYFPVNFGGSWTSEARLYSIFATYTASAGTDVDAERDAEIGGVDTVTGERDAEIEGQAAPVLTAVQDGSDIDLSWTYNE